MDEIDDDFSFWNINSVLNHIINNFPQFLLLIFVFVIIYIVDYINNLNTVIYSGIPIIKKKKHHK